MEPISQKVRKRSPEMDPLRLGTGWREEDLGKLQIMVWSSFGDSHPGSGHLNRLGDYVKRGISEAGGHGASYFCTDMCDGESQGNDGINYSLASREYMASMIEIQANATPFDGAVYLASCDKSVPASLIGMARVNAPAIFMPGGTMKAGPDLLTLNQLGAYSARYERGEITEGELNFAKCNACPGFGACSFIGTASTMQIMGEALGLALPGSSLLPAEGELISFYAEEAGRRATALAKEGLRPSDIVTKKSFENAVILHAVIGGSTNCLLHLPAIAHEYGIDLDGDTFDRLHRNVPFLLNLRPCGKWPAEFFAYAGGLPRIMEEVKDLLHLDVLTVTGKTLGENLDELKKNGYYERADEMLKRANAERGLNLVWQDIVSPRKNPLGENGSVAVLKGNLAPEGAVIKHSACPKEMFRAVLRARPFDSEEECLDAVLHKKVKPGEAVLIRYEGPRGSGMPEMFYTTEAISSDPELARSIALITDGRFSGASTGPVIGHVSPEGADGGPIALVMEGDLIELDVENRKLSVVGIDGVRMSEDEVMKVFEERRKTVKIKPPRYQKGALGLYAKHATSPMMGAYMD